MPATPSPLETLRAAALLALLGPAAAATAAELPTLDCVITPSAKVELSSAVPGLIAAVHVDRSDTVEQGQTVAELASGVERAAVNLARAKAAMDAEVHLQAVSLEYDRRNQRRVRDLAARAVASDQDKDQADRDTELSRWELRQAENLMTLRRLELARAEEVLREKQVISPIDGVVVQRYKSPGEYVEDRPILRVVRLDPLHVETIVPMEYFGQLHPGMAAEVVPETLSAEAHRARVAVVDRMGDAASGTFGLRLEMANPDNRLPAGTKCSVRFLPGEPAPQPAAPRGIPPLNPPAPPPAGPGVPAGEVVVRTEAGTPSSDVETVAAGGSCQHIGPLEDRTTVRALAGALRDRGLEPRIQRGNAEHTIGYLVVTSPRASLKAAAELNEHLGSRGIRDRAVLARGPFANRVSLGAYDRRDDAERRQRELAALGITTEVKARTRQAVGWWLLVAAPDAALETALRSLSQASGTATAWSPGQCAGALAAVDGPAP